MLTLLFDKLSRFQVESLSNISHEVVLRKHASVSLHLHIDISNVNLVGVV